MQSRPQSYSGTNNQIDGAIQEQGSALIYMRGNLCNLGSYAIDSQPYGIQMFVARWWNGCNRSRHLPLECNGINNMHRCVHALIRFARSNPFYSVGNTSNTACVDLQSLDPPSKIILRVFFLTVARSTDQLRLYEYRNCDILNTQHTR
jgi:hypothetical protein